MKHLLTLFSALCLAVVLQAQVSKTVNLTTAGTLASVLTADEKKTITDLTVTGSIDARDFKTMRDSMRMVANVNMSTATVVAYSGTEGTNGTESFAYGANVMPIRACIYKSSLKSFQIPNSITEIGDCAFKGCHGLASITIPTSITIIGVKAFSSCYKLITFDIPNSVTKIGVGAFEYCSGLTSIIIPNSVTTIGASAFYVCRGLTSVTISNSITTIEASTFFDCWGLTSLTIPNSVTAIADSAFWRCNSLPSITVPSSVNEIGRNAFTGCYDLTSFFVDANNNKYSSVDGLLYNKKQDTLIQCPLYKKTSVSSIPSSVTTIGDGAFMNCGNLTSVLIPSSVNSIGNYAFAYCSDLISITIPSSVTMIGGSAFLWCHDFTMIYTQSAIPVTISSNVFLDVKKTIPLYVPRGAKAAYAAADVWKEFTNIIECDSTIQVATTSIDLTNTTSAKIAITTFSQWTATSTQPWLTITPASGDGAGEITITAEPNTTGATRTATITIASKLKADGGSKTITVTQAAQGTAVGDELAVETIIYPNPTQSQIIISAPTAEGQSVSLIAPNGAVIAQTIVSNGKAEFSAVGLAKGIYSVQLQTNDNVLVQRVIVE